MNEETKEGEPPGQAPAAAEEAKSIGAAATGQSCNQRSQYRTEKILPAIHDFAASGFPGYSNPRGISASRGGVEQTF